MCLAEFGYNKNMEAEITYERYLNDFVRVFGGVNMENEEENSLDEISTTAVAGIQIFHALYVQPRCSGR